MEDKKFSTGECQALACGKVLLVIAPAVFLAPSMAEAGIVSGVTKVVMGVLGIPMSILAGTLSGPPIIGTLAGALSGTAQGVGLVLSGAVDLAAAAIPLAKAAAPYVFFFL